MILISGESPTCVNVDVLFILFSIELEFIFGVAYESARVKVVVASVMLPTVEYGCPLNASL